MGEAFAFRLAMQVVLGCGSGTLVNAEVLALNRFDDPEAVQCVFDAWHEIDNFERPQEALDQEVSARSSRSTRFSASNRRCGRAPW